MTRNPRSAVLRDVTTTSPPADIPPTSAPHSVGRDIASSVSPPTSSPTSAPGCRIPAKQFEVIVVGIGISGCYAALNLPENIPILMLCKTTLEESNAFLAQGGICVQKDENDFDSFFEDTLRAGHYKNNPEAVATMIHASRDIIDDLMRLGVAFEKEGGQLLYTREAAHTTNRIVYHSDTTGQAITSVLLERVQERPNITILAQTTMTDLMVDDGKLKGIRAHTASGAQAEFLAREVILATGGVGGNFEHSTNYSHLTGDAVAIAQKHGIQVTNPNQVQIHPTTLYSEEPGRRFLISESVRGEGAVLLNKDGERFVDELLPRDEVSEKIYAQMEKDGTNYVWLSLGAHMKVDIKKRFFTIYQHCLSQGYDITKEPIPVVPAQHYYMGGIEVDLQGRTSMPHVYAVGEVSCNGVHGANRLASNSLLESLVFAQRAAQDITHSHTSHAARRAHAGSESPATTDQAATTNPPTVADSSATTDSPTTTDPNDEDD